MKTKFQSIVLVLIGFVLGCNEFIIVGILSDVSRTFSVNIASRLFGNVVCFDIRIFNAGSEHNYQSV